MTKDRRRPGRAPAGPSDGRDARPEQRASGAPGDPPVVAIDGPAGAGKSTIARAVAERLGLERLDTGAMYRAVAYSALGHGVDLADQDAVAAQARGLALEVGEHVRVDGVDATSALRTPAVDAAVSVVAANPGVRTELVERQRAWLRGRRGGVVEGRDIGTVVLPDADLKVYLTASAEERARRRAVEHGAPDMPEVARAIARRDRLDSTRAVSPLPGPDDVAADAVVIDSTGRDVQAVVDEVLACLARDPDAELR